MASPITHTKPKTNLALKEPPMYNVIYVNDNVTSMDFVIESLVTVFNYEPTDALKLTTEIHEKGSGVAATLPYEMAEHKGVEVTQLARASGYPLNIKIEAE
jgi:ATP-dependent Clp protease adaptor protein ClpS